MDIMQRAQELGANAIVGINDDGNLTITMPKTEPQQKVSKAIEVS